MKKLIAILALTASVIAASAPAFAAQNSAATSHQVVSQQTQATGNNWFDDQAKGPL